MFKSKKSKNDSSVRLHLSLHLHELKGGALSHFVTPNFVQAVLWMDHEENLRSEVISLHFDLHEFRKYGKIPLISL